MASLNHSYARAIIELLIQAGVEHAFIAPGSRSAPLALASAQRLPYCQHIDERGLAFFALGYSHCQGPAVVICTSGTAVANLVPAAVEAYQQGRPLVLLTADRPQELIDVGANQAIHQPELLAANINQRIHIEAPDTPQAVQAALATIAQGLALTGPVHLNIALREPLYEDDEHRYDLPAVRRPAALASAPLRPISGPTLLVAGQLTKAEAQALLACAERLNLPILADLTSQLPAHPLVIQGGEHLVRQGTLTGFERVIQWGGRIISKQVNQWLAHFDGDYELVRSIARPLDPSGRSQQFHSDIVASTKALTATSTDQPKIDRTPIERFRSYVSQLPFGELSACQAILSSLRAPWQIFVGNSLAPRWLDLLADCHVDVLANRGASGIDGLLATACGVSLSAPTLAVLGDSSLLHDLNSLLIGAQHPGQGLVVVVLNNDGGNIFDMLPIQGHHQQTELFRLPHGCQFAAACQQFAWQYQACFNQQALNDALADLRPQQPPKLIEVVVPAQQATEHWQRWLHG